MNSGYAYRFDVPPEAAGISLATYLATRFPHTSVTVWRERIDAGRVTIDGHLSTGDAPLHTGQAVVWSRPPWVEPETPLHYRVLLEDADLLFVDKPAGLPTLPGGGYLEHTLQWLVRRDFPDAAPAHRLGRWTSGIVVFGRTTEARRSLSAQFAGGSLRKRYRALASGNPRWRRRRIAVPIGPVPYPPLGKLHAANWRGRPSRSDVFVVRRRGDVFVCDVVIATGRPHQIRIHLAAAGHPLLGDPLYVTGGVPGPRPGLPGEGGYRLHAHRLVLDHPATGARLALECGLPPGLR